MKAGIIAGFALLWRLLLWTWSILIVGIIIGILGNAAFTYVMTGEMNFKDPRTLTVGAWLNTHLTLCVALLIPILVITLCSYFAHYWQRMVAQQQRRTHGESLIVVAKGVQRALDQLNAQPAVLPTSPTPTAMTPANQEASPSKIIWNVPFRRNPFFTGREELLKRLHDNLTSRKAATLTQAISGLGGIGKTQTAVKYAYRYRDEYHEVLWVVAATRDTLTKSFLDLARLLNLPEKDEQNQSITVQAVKRWLEQHDHWLLIVDNADDLALAEEFLPTGGKGHILLTTRAQAPGTLANKIDVEKMDKDEGMLFLLRRAKVLTIETPLSQSPETDRVAAETIVKEMDGLPLALDQAGAYIEETDCGASAYLVSYRRHQAELLKRRGGTGKDHPEPVATTWSLSFEQVEQLNPMAADLLGVCAFLAPDAIPEELLLEGASQLGKHLQPLTTDATRLNDAIGVLLRYSLVERDTREHTLSIHRLVQAVHRDNLDEQNQRLWAERAIRAVQVTLPPVEHGSWLSWERLVAHAQTCAEWVNQHEIHLLEARTLLQKTGWYLMERAQYPQAQPLLERANQISMQEHGAEHLETANTASVLGLLYQAQGKYDQAQPLLESVLSLHNQQVGPEHPVTAYHLNNLASLYHDQGKYVQAGVLYQHAHMIYEQQMGPEHPNTAASLHNLASLYKAQGKYIEAEPLEQRALSIRQQQVGSEHPTTAHSLNNLAGIYQALGRYAEAESLCKRALSIREQRLGPEHPVTALSLSNLAGIYQALGRYAEAEPLCKRALSIREQRLGPMHPDTATSLNNLAELYRAQGRYEQAEPLYQRALAIHEQRLGPMHPDTVTIRENYHALVRDMKQKGKGSANTSSQ